VSSRDERLGIVSPELVRKLITALAGAAELLGTDPDYRNGQTHRFAVGVLDEADKGGAWLGGVDAAAVIRELSEALVAAHATLANILGDRDTARGIGPYFAAATRDRDVAVAALKYAGVIVDLRELAALAPKAGRS
jgi:hypothetical protein